jgi:hypothetical protein
MDPEQYGDELDKAYRAIGLYIVRYSELVHYMRFLMARRLTRGEANGTLGEIALGESSHFNIAQAFFAMCRFDNELTKAEIKVESALRGRFVKINEKRTDYAHGDWIIGLADEDRMLPPAVGRVRPRASEPYPEKLTAVPVDDLNEQSAEILTLLEQTAAFGKVCLDEQILLAQPPPGVGPIVPRGTLRVNDILAVENGQVVQLPKFAWLQRPETV